MTLARRTPLRRKRPGKRRTTTPRCDRCTRAGTVTIWPEGEVCFGDTPPCFTQSFVAREGVCVCASGDADRRTLATLLCLTHAKREADRLARQVVLYRDGYRCVACGKTDREGATIEWAHVIRRSQSLALRWLEDGAVALCHEDHMRFDVNEKEWRAWLEENRPGLWDRLNAIRVEAIRAGQTPDIGLVISELRSRVPKEAGR